MTKCLIILFMKSSKSIQHNAALAITGAIRGSSKEKLYQGLGFESLQQRRWYTKLCLFFKIIKNQSPKYLFELIPTAREAYTTRHKNSINSFFPSTIIEWNNSESLAIFKKHILAFIRPTVNSTFHCHSPDGLKLQG